MKKIVAVTAGLLVGGSLLATSASAIENQFGGYWRTRAISKIDFKGTDTGAQSWVDTRTRLFYTAVFNENFKFVNKFEMDAIWGGASDGYGDVGSDGVSVEVKNSYVDFNVGITNFKIGIQTLMLARKWLIDPGGHDVSGAYVTVDAGQVLIPMYYLKPGEEEAWGSGTESDILAIAPVFGKGGNVKVQPYVMYEKGADGLNDWVDPDSEMYWIGADVDVKAGPGHLWFTGIYNGGEKTADNGNIGDVTGYVIAGGGKFGMFHFEGYYGNGDDDLTDDDTDAFQPPSSGGRRTSELLGTGFIDFPLAQKYQFEVESASNILALNVGAKVSPLSKLTFKGDLWYFTLNEETDESNGETDLGVEVDLKAEYLVRDNLKLVLSGAYLFAGDAYGEEDPIELAAVLHFGF